MAVCGYEFDDGVICGQPRDHVGQHVRWGELGEGRASTSADEASRTVAEAEVNSGKGAPFPRPSLSPLSEPFQNDTDRAGKGFGEVLANVTPDQVVEAIGRALKDGDMEAVEALMLALAYKDPHRAEEVYETMKIGLAYRQRTALNG